MSELLQPGGASSYHEPILVEEILQFAAKCQPRWLVDGTLGDGGHSLAFLRRFPGARLLAADRDPSMLDRARARLTTAGYADRATFLHCNFRDLPEQLEARRIAPDFILLDLGISMHHFRGARRGFSYEDAESLDMRLDPTVGAPAADLINSADMSELQWIFQEYGEEPFAGRIARAIVEARPILTARELGTLIRGAVPLSRPDRKSSTLRAGRGSGGPGKRGPEGRGGRIHPATRVFQALRIAVNDELGAIAAALAPGALPATLAPGGRLAVISFHSLEDRSVKNAFREIGVPAHQRRAAQAGYRILTRKPVAPGAAEIEGNPASRSAKLRVLERSAENDIAT